MSRFLAFAGFVLFSSFCMAPPLLAQRKVQDAKNTSTGKANPFEDPEFAKYAIYAASAPRASKTEPLPTSLPLKLSSPTRVALIGNMLLERSQHFGYLEALLHQHYAGNELSIRHLGWPADTAVLQPRP